ncbi:hypothetical protein Droror1_Dr00017133 [Drosera rotundifolia]
MSTAKNFPFLQLPNSQHLILIRVCCSRFLSTQLVFSLCWLCSSSRRRWLKYPTLVVASVVDTFSKNSGYLFELSESASGSIIEYDISNIIALYVRKPLVLMQRVFQIGTTFGRWFAMRYVEGLMGRADAMFKVRAAELRKIFVEFGPAYVKVAQSVLSRPDLILPLLFGRALFVARPDNSIFK